MTDQIEAMVSALLEPLNRSRKLQPPSVRKLPFSISPVGGYSDGFGPYSDGLCGLERGQTGQPDTSVPWELGIKEGRDNEAAGVHVLCTY